MYMYSHVIACTSLIPRLLLIISLYLTCAGKIKPKWKPGNKASGHQQRKLRQKCMYMYSHVIACTSLIPRLLLIITCSLYLTCAGKIKPKWKPGNKASGLQTRPLL